MTEISELLKNGESEKIEFKKSSAQLERGLKAVCAFSNHSGGGVYFGIHGGKAVGQEVSDSTLRSISQKIRQKIKPEVSPEIKVLGAGGKKIIEVEVKEGKNKLYYLDGIAYKRVGTENVVIPPEELERIILDKKKRYFDSEICEKACLEDIDWGVVKDFFMPRYESLSKSRIMGAGKELLEALNCIRDNKPTNAGVLLFGKNPQKFFMNSYIALARYKGEVESAERLDYKEFDGNLFVQIDSCDEYIKEHTAIMSTLLPHKVEREDIPEYCWFSIRELITNAVCHRDYSEQGSKTIIKMFKEHIDYYNPGGLPAGVTPENITEKQYSRNPVISGVLAKIKYIEELGEGWNKIIDEHRKHSLKPRLPGIKADKYSTMVTLFSTKEKFEKGRSELNERQKKAIEYTRRKGKITNTEYQEINETTNKTAARDLRDIVRREILIKKGRTGRGVHYTLNPIYKEDITGHNRT